MQTLPLILAALVAGPLRLPAQAPKSQAPRTTELTPVERATLRERIAMIAWRDQQFRRYTANGTLDEELLSKVREMDLQELMRFKRSHKNELTDADRKLLQRLQRHNDKLNHEAFIHIVKNFGYPSAKRLGVKTDRLFALLLHPPVASSEIEKHLETMTALLKPEVLAGNMPARSFALFYDNMLAKILRRGQLYGTNKRFNPATRKVEPPLIEDLEKTNAARREIGLAPLREGEYQIRK